MEDFEDDEPTAAQVFKKLTDVWRNEKGSPDLLMNHNDLVECMMDQIKQMEENLKSLTHDDFLLVPHKMEIDRIRFVIASYLRTRLKKIESFPVFYLNRDKALPENNRFMSESEYIFAEQFAELLRNHFQGEAFRYMPTLLHEFGGNVDIEVRPNMRSVVVFKANKTIEGVLINGKPVDLKANHCFFVPFKDVRIFIEKGALICN